MRPYRTKNGKYVIATMMPSVKRFKCIHTRTGKVLEAGSIDDLADAIEYINKPSAKRAIRKRKEKDRELGQRTN